MYSMRMATDIPAGGFKGRGALSNPHNRFDHQRSERVDDGWFRDEPETSIATELRPDATRGIIARNDSPDIPFDQSINPYRGCEHGCIYCFARPTHAYLGLSPGLDFETRLFAKTAAPELLRRELSHPNYVCDIIALGANTDPYQPIEREHCITRGILEVLRDFNHPVCV